MGQRLSDETWTNIFGNLSAMDPEDYYDGDVSWVEILWLDGTQEYVLAFGDELYEDGFTSEKEAEERLRELEKRLGF